MWKFKFWLAIAKMYNRLADVTLGVSRFLVERGKHGIKKHDEYYAEEVYYDYEMKYNKKTKAYECILRGGSGKKSLMYLESISVEDEYGNRTWYASYNRGKKWKKWKKAIKKMVFYRK